MALHVVCMVEIVGRRRSRLTSLREAAAFVEEMARGGRPGAYIEEFANAVHRLDVRLEAIESVLAALIRKTGLMFEETTSPEPQGFEQHADQQKRSAEVLLQIQRLLEGKAEWLRSG
jgi:hypothetical protein